MKEKFRANYLTNSIIFLFPIITLFVLSPLEIYGGNQGEMNFAIGDFIGMFFGIAIVVFIVGSILLTILPDRLQKICRAVIFVLSVMAYIQNMFLNKTLMRTDGSKLDWNALKGYTILNTVIWIIGCLLLSVGIIALKKKGETVIKWGSAFLSAIEVVAVVSLLLTNPFVVSADAVYMLDGSKQMKVAKDNNIIVFVLDRYGNITFENGYEKSKSFLDPYQDFIFYQNANSKYNYTFPSIPYMLTHEEVDCTLTTGDYKHFAWTEGKSKDFYQTLNKNHYTYHFYSGSGRAIFTDAGDLIGSIDNISQVERDNRIVHKDVLGKLMFKTTLYKYAPYILKPYLEVLSFYYDGVITYAGGVSPVEDNGDYYKLLKEEGLTIDENMENGLIITHLTGIHTPYTIGEDAQTVPDNDTELYACQRGLNVIMQEYMYQLKELGVYDSATIIITADHGLYVEALDPQPIYLIKYPEQKFEEMQFTNAPISSEDFLPTILELIGEDYSAYGTPISMWDDSSDRTRLSCFPNNGFDVYSYDTDREELRDKISGGDCGRIDATEDWD